MSSYTMTTTRYPSSVGTGTRFSSVHRIYVSRRIKIMTAALTRSSCE